MAATLNNAVTYRHNPMVMLITPISVCAEMLVAVPPNEPACEVHHQSSERRRSLAPEPVASPR